MKQNKNSFIIIRVTDSEKKELQQKAKTVAKRFSVFIRMLLGLK
jgi:hypothetical protein